MKKIGLLVISLIGMILLSATFNNFYQTSIDTSYQDSLNINTIFSMYSGRVREMVIQDSFAFVTSGYSLIIYKMGSDSLLDYVSRVSLPSYTYSLFATDTLVYVVCSHNLISVSISNIEQPKVIDAFESAVWNDYSRIVVKDSIMYAIRNTSLLSINIKDLSAPQYISELNYDCLLSDLLLTDSLIYIAATDNGFRCIAIDDSFNLSDIGSWSGPFPIYKIQIRDSIAYLTDNGCGFWLVNIKNPLSMQQINYTYLTWTAAELALYDDYAFISMLSEGFCAIDISDPMDLNNCYHFTTSDLGVNIGVIDSLVIVADNEGVTVFDVNSDSLLSRLDMLEDPSKVKLNKDYAFLYCRNRTMKILDVGDPYNPIICSNYALPDGIVDYCIDSNMLYLITSEITDKLIIIDVSDPFNPLQLSVFDSLNLPTKICVDGGNLYLVNNRGLTIFDVTDPFNPYILGQEIFICYPVDMEVNGDYVIISDNAFGINIYDISDPSNPIYSGHFNKYLSENIFVSDKYIYILDADSTLTIANWENLDSIYQKNSYKLNYRMNDLSVENGRLFINAYESGLRVFDLGDFSNIQEIGFYDTPGICVTAATKGDYIYLPDYYTFYIAKLNYTGLLSDTIPEREKNIELVISKNILSITTNNEKSSITIIDKTGRAVLNKRFKSCGKNDINIDGLNNGIYFIIVKDGDIRYSRKFVRLR
ncbi:MAG: T9SS type A sorting domain-containing protein [bacterium]